MSYILKKYQMLLFTQVHCCTLTTRGHSSKASTEVLASEQCTTISHNDTELFLNDLDTLLPLDSPFCHFNTLTQIQPEQNRQGTVPETQGPTESVLQQCLCGFMLCPEASGLARPVHSDGFMGFLVRPHVE